MWSLTQLHSIESVKIDQILHYIAIFSGIHFTSRLFHYLLTVHISAQVMSCCSLIGMVHWQVNRLLGSSQFMLPIH